MELLNTPLRGGRLQYARRDTRVEMLDDIIMVEEVVAAISERDGIVSRNEIGSLRSVTSTLPGCIWGLLLWFSTV